MSKEHSDGDTRLTPNKYSGEMLSVAEQTQRAIQYYGSKRKDYLVRVRSEFVAMQELGKEREKKEF